MSGHTPRSAFTGTACYRDPNHLPAETHAHLFELMAIDDTENSLAGAMVNGDPWPAVFWFVDDFDDTHELHGGEGCELSALDPASARRPASVIQRRMTSIVRPPGDHPIAVSAALGTVVAMHFIEWSKVAVYLYLSVAPKGVRMYQQLTCSVIKAS